MSKREAEGSVQHFYKLFLIWWSPRILNAEYQCGNGVDLELVLYPSKKIKFHIYRPARLAFLDCKSGGHVDKKLCTGDCHWRTSCSPWYFLYCSVSTWHKDKFIPLVNSTSLLKTVRVNTEAGLTYVNYVSSLPRDSSEAFRLEVPLASKYGGGNLALYLIRIPNCVIRHSTTKSVRLLQWLLKTK